MIACILGKSLLKHHTTCGIGLSLAILFSVMFYLLILRLCNGITHEEYHWFMNILRKKKKSAE